MKTSNRDTRSVMTVSQSWVQAGSTDTLSLARFRSSPLGLWFRVHLGFPAVLELAFHYGVIHGALSTINPKP